VVEKEAMDRSIASLHEGFGETADVEALHTLFAIIPAAEKLDARVGVVGIKFHNLVVVNISSLNIQ
jgi:hypothetical protein